MSYKVAVVGASGNVGHEMLTILHERNFPVSEIHAVASARSAGKEVSFGDKNIKIEDLAKFDFKGIDIVLSSPGATISAEFAPRAAAAGAVVIDNTSHFRMDPDVPLVVPEVNPKAIADYKKKRIIANPNCSTIQMVVALKPLHDAAKIKRVVVSTYQSVSGAGKEAMDELFNQTRSIFMNATPEPKQFKKQISFNAIPQIDVFMDDRRTKEEWKMDVETKKILGRDIKVCANCVRVPMFIGHAEMVNVEFERELSALDALAILQKTKGISVIDLESEMEFVTPVEIQGEDDVFVSRMRDDSTVDFGLNFWCVADNLRKGAALNAVQIAELLIRDYLKK
ncbi:MAG: aspartate-semialdehyde dehydrogenase [Alphaproteobacteria bacterium]|jgi:aspartate-semialdehyde dehydrogenase|nr:aspartate-semialdehyde dehydrogenase [Alphaproteobacteria bacterium]MCB1551822.1 aspartate-semialdehyde dehydrogenase [Alphaproteobacteria bacterium]MCB9984207.1 aspartate-semialdehyde dehydrogenase [Micavibrio sp.]HRK97051.1 aspartate-semialdehyde dehydrogenase [Alphaproteobacteria bacterium]